MAVVIYDNEPSCKLCGDKKFYYKNGVAVDCNCKIKQ